MDVTRELDERPADVLVVPIADVLGAGAPATWRPAHAAEGPLGDALWRVVQLGLNGTASRARAVRAATGTQPVAVFVHADRDDDTALLRAGVPDHALVLADVSQGDRGDWTVGPWVLLLVRRDRVGALRPLWAEAEAWLATVAAEAAPVVLVWGRDLVRVGTVTRAIH